MLALFYDKKNRKALTDGVYLCVTYFNTPVQNFKKL
jgi:hypothetical protein